MIATYIEVSAGVRYWEDATVNGVEDKDGTLIPCRIGGLWMPIIRLDGVVLHWPQGVEADIHYKVCDDGKYWLLDHSRKRIAEWRDYYVPTAFLCQCDRDSDYIIMRVDAAGRILDWQTPSIKQDDWQPINGQEGSP